MRSERVRLLAEIALTVALCAVLKLWRIQLPWNFAGGDISLVMLPVLVLALRRGVMPAAVAGAAFGVVDFFFEPFVVAPIQVLLDYPVAFALLSVAGFGARQYRSLLNSGRRMAAEVVAVPWMIAGVVGAVLRPFCLRCRLLRRQRARGHPGLDLLGALQSRLPGSVADRDDRSCDVRPSGAGGSRARWCELRTQGLAVRALLVCAAPVEGSAELLRQLTADADLVIAVDGGGALCLEAGVVPHVVLGDFDSLSPADLERLNGFGAEIRRFPAEKDSSDLELAVAEARRRGATSVVLTAATSGRLDHTLAVLGVLSASADLASRLVDPQLEVWTLSASGRETIALSGVDATLSLLAFGAPAMVSAQGVVWELDAARIEPTSSRGLSNRIGASGQARITAVSGVVLVFSPQLAGAVRAQAT